MTIRVATAFDAHKFSDDPRRPLWLGCLEWEGLPGLVGHSDADVAAHAACDALLMATGIGELGTIFGTGRPEWDGASGETLLRESVKLVHEAGWEIANVSVQIIGQRPRFASRKAEAEAARIISQLDANTADAISLLPDFLPPSAASAPPLEASGVNGSGVGGTATASSTLSSSGFQNGAFGSAQTASPLGANASTSAIASQASGGRISASGVGEIGGHLGSGADVDPTVVSASSKTLGLNAASEFSSATSPQALSATELTSLAHEGGGAATVSASSRASQLGAVVSPALMAAGLPKVLTGNILSLRGATGGSSPISAQPAGRASLAPTQGSGATTMGARPATAGAGTRASNLGARSRTTAGTSSASLKASGGTTAPRAAATSGRAASAQGSRVLSPRTPAQGAAGNAVGRAGSQGVPARGASGKTQARGALGRDQRAFGLGRAASNKKKDDPKATEHLGEQVLTTDSRLSFLGRGQREDTAKRDVVSDSE